MTSLLGGRVKSSALLLYPTAREQGHEPNIPLYHTLAFLSSKIVKKYCTNIFLKLCAFCLLLFAIGYGIISYTKKQGTRQAVQKVF